MIEFITSENRITIVDDPTHVLGSTDNVRFYNNEYVLDKSDSHQVTSRHGVLVTDADELVASCILIAGGGATGVHQNSALINNRSCIVAVGPFVALLHIPKLELEWATQTDDATCFGVYYSEKHHCLISHGELEIARLSFDGRIVWRAGGADIFTNGFTLFEDYVQVHDWNDSIYRIDIETGGDYAA